jgi:hypothetical protein
MLFLGSGCTWGRSMPENCARFTKGSGLTRIAELAAADGIARVEIQHKRELLAGLPRVRRTEVGSCARVTESLPASATAVAASVGRWCNDAIARQVRYADWSSVVGDQFLFVSELRTIEQPLSPVAPD